MRKFARVVPILSSYTRGTDLKAQINICMLQNPPETPSQRGIYLTFSRGVFTCRTNNERSRCVQLPLAYSLSGYGCIPSTQHRPTYPFPSLCLFPSPSFPAREKSPELTLIFPRLRQPGTGSERRCYNILHVRQSCLPEGETERPRGPQIPTTRDPPTPRRPEQGKMNEDGATLALPLSTPGLFSAFCNNTRRRIMRFPAQSQGTLQSNTAATVDQGGQGSSCQSRLQEKSK